jgi:hypothetical protein
VRDCLGQSSTAPPMIPIRYTTGTESHLRAALASAGGEVVVDVRILGGTPSSAMSFVSSLALTAMMM